MKKVISIFLLSSILFSCTKHSETSLYVDPFANRNFDILKILEGSQLDKGKLRAQSTYNVGNLDKLKVIVSIYEPNTEKQIIFESEVSSTGEKGPIVLSIVSFVDTMYLAFSQNGKNFFSYQLSEQDKLLLQNRGLINTNFVGLTAGFKLFKDEEVPFAFGLFDTEVADHPIVTRSSKIVVQEFVDELTKNQILVLVELQNLSDQK